MTKNVVSSRRFLAASIVETYETIRRRKDGTDFHVSVTVSPLFDGQGRVIGASKIARDITERVQQQDLCWRRAVNGSVKPCNTRRRSSATSVKDSIR